MANAIKLEAGDHLPLHASASGKLYLSFLKEQDATDIFKNIKTPKTAKNTIIEINQFKKELRKINSQKLKLPSGKTLKGKQRNKFEVNKIKIDVLKSELIASLN